MTNGWCTLEDVRRALRKASLPGDVGQEDQIAIDKVEAQTEPLEKVLDRYWYAESGDQILTEASSITIPQSPATRDDEHSLPTHGGYVDGAYGGEPYRATNTSNTAFSSEQTASSDPKKQIRVATGDLDDETTPTYTRIQLDRKDADTVNALHIATADGGFDDWVASNDYDGGVGFDSHAGDDFYVRVNNGGVSELYIDIHSLDDGLFTLSNAVVVDFDYGHAGIPQNVRQGVANLAAAELVEEAVIEIPENTTLYDIETKAEELRTTAYDQYLSVYLPDGAEFRGGER
jgi:hypothetical protein